MNHALESEARSRIIVRKAEAHRVQMGHQAGQAHRSAAGWTIDYRLQEATNDMARAISTVPGHFIDKPAFGSPWHYHDCDLQVAFVLEGSIELGYAADTYSRAGKGDILFIPGHTLHDVSNPSSDYQVAEITFPGTFGTTEAEMPLPGAATAARTWGSSAAVRLGERSGIIDYRYPVEAPYDSAFAIRRQVRSRTEDFVPSAERHEDRCRFTIVTKGWREVEQDGETIRLDIGDILVVPAGTDCRNLAVADDYEAIEVRQRA